MTSLLARASAFGIRALRIGSPYVSEEALAHHIEHNRIGPVQPSWWMRRRFDVSSRLYRGHEVFTVGPKPGRGRHDDRPARPGRVLYLHGGAFVEGIFWWHWYFIVQMVERLGMTFTVPLYPLAPEHDAATTGAFVLDLYRDLVADHAEPWIVMGDSAGGGLTVTLTQQAAAAGLTPPAALVLLSPWLDLTMTDPAQDALEKVDPLLSRAGPAAAARWYAGAWPTADPRVSPMFGDIAALPRTLLLCGTHDILVTDARRFKALADAAGVPVEYNEEDGLIHAYPLLFFPESRKARDRIMHFVIGAVREDGPHPCDRGDEPAPCGRPYASAEPAAERKGRMR
jgi:monoterpene epsilon-lactone hydrolase